LSINEDTRCIRSFNSESLAIISHQTAIDSAETAELLSRSASTTCWKGCCSIYFVC